MLTSEICQSEHPCLPKDREKGWPSYQLPSYLLELLLGSASKKGKSLNGYPFRNKVANVTIISSKAHA